MLQNEPKAGFQFLRCFVSRVLADTEKFYAEWACGRANQLLTCILVEKLADNIFPPLPFYTKCSLDGLGI